MATIYEIARAAGVSPSTVARALRGSGYVSPDKRALIQKLAREMGYVPNHAARSLKSKRSQKVLFLIPDIYNPFYFRMIKGATEVLEEHQYFPVLCHTKGDPALEMKMLSNLQQGFGDGMIFVSFDFNPKNTAAVNASGCPVVLTNNYQSPDGRDAFDCVFVDTFDGIRMAAQHFISRGFTRIGYIGGNIATQTGRERFSGFQHALQQNHIAADQRLFKVGDFTMESGRRAMQELIDQRTIPQALVVANDLMAIGAMRVCKEQGIHIPGDLAIIGMDNSDLAQFLDLSSIQMCEEEIGRNAARLLMERIENPKLEKRTIRLQPSLALRKTSEAGEAPAG
ncbi:MAG: LacI family transcriptional regulator [Clostridiales bacterium]|jgi:LacI family transcriptional regulator|nr:LacI family transcriptional regulator [Clostridiales bacterium]